MTDTTELPTVQAALAQVAFDLGPVGKTEQNKEQGFSYRGIEQILAKAGPLMSAAGILWLPKVVERDVEIILVGKYQKPWRLVSLRVEYTIVGPAGDTLVCTSYGEGFDPGDKSGNKAMSGAFKYALLQVLAISSGHDDSDADPTPDLSGRGERSAAKKGASSKNKPNYEDAPVREPKAVKPKAAPKADPETGEVNPPDAEALAAAFPGAAVVSQDDERRGEIGALLSAIDDEPYRIETKRLFLETFGGAPSLIPDDQLDEALAFTNEAVESQPF